MVGTTASNGPEEKPKTEEKQKDKFELMMDEFDSKRSSLSGDMINAANAFKNTKTLLEAEHLLYHVRQKLVDYKRELTIAMSSINKTFKKMKQARLVAHKSDKVAILPANATEKKVLDEAYFSSVEETIEKFDAQFTWTKDSINGCDEMSNGISYYIKLANLLGGGTN